MIKVKILIGLLICSAMLTAQKADYTWLQGYSFGTYGYDTSFRTFAGLSIMNFNYSPVVASYDTTYQINFDETNTGYSDTNGNLLFYTNGMLAVNSLGEIIEGSDSINQGYYWKQWYPMGYRAPQGILAFQSSANDNQYYLIHSFWDKPADILDQFANGTLSSLLDMSQNAGLGRMIYANNVLIKDSLGWELAAIRHGNGRDWWVLIQKRNSNCFYRVLLDAEGFHLMPDLGCGGAFISIDDGGASAFSADGSKFAHFTVETGLSIFNFDRCTGELSDPVYIPSNIWGDSSWEGFGLAFSPSSRFLYISATKRMLQYDLWASDISSSVDTVGIYDGYYVVNPDFATVFNTAQVGPDGKIYISCGNSVEVYHVINSPDLKGDSCDFRQHSFPLPSPSLGVPNFPNYRLGALTGSACDTLTGLSEVVRAQKESILKVFPNPATDLVTIDYGFTDWSKTGAVSLEISNELGQVVYKQVLPQYSGFQKLDVIKFAAGVYTAFIKRSGQVVAVKKFAKE